MESRAGREVFPQSKRVHELQGKGGVESGYNISLGEWGVLRGKKK